MTIKSEEEYESVLEEIEHLWGSESGTPEGERFDALVEQVLAYEQEHYELPLPDPIEAIKYYMESRGLSHGDLAKYVGAPSLVAAVLEGERPLTPVMAINLTEALDIPPEILMRPYESFTDSEQEGDSAGCGILQGRSGSKTYYNFNLDREEQDVPSYGQPEHQKAWRGPARPVNDFAVASSCA